jgi:hypothetical protein
MKRLLIIVLTIAVPSLLLAQNEVSKKVEKSYTVSGNGSLAVNGKYGDIHIDTWDTKKVEVKVVIEVKKRTEKLAQEMLDKISIGIEDGDKEALSFRTNIDGSINNKSGDRLKIEYWIKAPKSIGFNIKNNYGNFYIADNTGTNDFKIAYGNIKAEQCTGKSTLKVSYGNGEIKDFNDGSMAVSYSNLSFEKIGKATITNNYSNIDADDVGSVAIENRYGNFKVNRLKVLKGSSKYGNVTVLKLYKEIDFNIVHSGGIKVGWISKDFDKINIDAKYGSVGLKFEEGFGASIDADMTYCYLKMEGVPFDYSQIREKAQHSYYKGVVGSKTNAANRTISIKSSYGNAKLEYAD